MEGSCQNCPRNKVDCFNKDCITSGGLSRVATVVNNQLPGPTLVVSSNLFMFL